MGDAELARDALALRHGSKLNARNLTFVGVRFRCTLALQEFRVNGSSQPQAVIMKIEPSTTPKYRDLCSPYENR